MISTYLFDYASASSLTLVYRNVLSNQINLQTPKYLIGASYQPRSVVAPITIIDFKVLSFLRLTDIYPVQQIPSPVSIAFGGGVLSAASTQLGLPDNGTISISPLLIERFRINLDYVYYHAGAAFQTRFYYNLQLLFSDNEGGT